MKLLYLLISFCLASSFYDLFDGHHHHLFQKELCTRLLWKEAVSLAATCKLFHDLVSKKIDLDDGEKLCLMKMIKSKAEDVELEGLLHHNWYNLDFVDDEGMNIMRQAVFSGNKPSIIKLLHRKGFDIADPKLMKPVFECIMYCTYGRANCQYLLDAGCALFERGQWNFLSTIILMEESHYFDMLASRNLIQDLINEPDHLGRTPIFYSNRARVANCLVCYGADPAILDNTGKSVVDNFRLDHGAGVDPELVEFMQHYCLKK